MIASFHHRYNFISECNLRAALWIHYNYYILKQSQSLYLIKCFSLPKQSASMSNYFPLTLNQWKIQKRPPDLQPNLSHSTKNQRRRSLAIHSLSLSAQKKVLRKSNEFRKHKSSNLREQKFEMRSSGGFKPYKTNRKASKNHHWAQQMEMITKTEERFYQNMKQKLRQKEMKGYILYKNKDLKSMNQSRLIAKKMQNLSDLLLVRTAQYFYNGVEAKDENIHCFEDRQDQQEEFSPYYRSKRVQTERQTARHNPVNTSCDASQRKNKKQGQQLNRHTKSKLDFMSSREKECSEDEHLFLSVKQMSLQKRRASRGMQMSAKAKYINYNQTMIDEQKKRSGDRVQHIRTQHIRTQHLPITPWDTRQKL